MGLSSLSSLRPVNPPPPPKFSSFASAAGGACVHVQKEIKDNQLENGQKRKNCLVHKNAIFYSNYSHSTPTLHPLLFQGGLTCCGCCLGLGSSLVGAGASSRCLCGGAAAAGGASPSCSWTTLTALEASGIIRAARASN
jgi:hypothetical protein